MPIPGSARGPACRFRPLAENRRITVGRFDPKSDVCAAFDKTHLASGQTEHASGVRSPEIYAIVLTRIQSDESN